jgi:hypothetical protein
VTVVDGHGKKVTELMDTAVLMEIESLRRASLAVLRDKFREVFQEETRCRPKIGLLAAARRRICFSKSTPDSIVPSGTPARI